MTDEDRFPGEETAPIAKTLAAPSPADTTAPTASSAQPVAPSFSPPSTLPAVVAPTPRVMTPAGWYPLNGEQRFWDGHQWTEHRAPATVPAYRPTFQVPVVMTDGRTNGAEVGIAWLLTFLSLGYMLPWAIAATRGKSNSWAVGLVNFLLGWTFAGWVVALVMACTAHQVAYVQPRL